MHVVRLILVSTLPALACAPPAVSDDPATQEQALRPTEDGEQPAAAMRRRPTCIPPRSFLACADLEVGDACSAMRPDGSSRDGVCRGPADTLYPSCAPPFPHPAAIAACEDSLAGERCSLTFPSGTTKAGICRRARDGTGPVACMLRPPPGAFAACADHEAHAPCSITLADGNEREGRCRPRPRGLACILRRPLRPCVPPAAVFACVDLSEDDSCSFTAYDGSARAGLCRSGPMENSALVCAPEPGEFEPEPL